METEKNYDYNFLLTILNLKIISWYFNYFLSGKIHFYPDNAKQMSIKIATVKQQKPFIEIVDKILAITGSGDYLENPAKQAKVKEYENQIDQMVYQLYGLTPEETKIVEKQK